MPINVQDFINVLAQFCEEKELRVAVSESLKGGLLTGCSALLGGLLLGPVGLAIGGAVGGGIAAATASGKFRSVAVVLMEMSPEKKKLLYDRSMYAFRNFSIHDVTTLSLLLLSNTSFQEIAMQQVVQFLRNDMQMNVQGGPAS